MPNFWAATVRRYEEHTNDKDHPYSVSTYSDGTTNGDATPANGNTKWRRWWWRRGYTKTNVNAGNTGNAGSNLNGYSPAYTDASTNPDANGNLRYG